MNSTEVHFLTFVRKTETCWFWEGWLNNGYGGYTTPDSKNHKAHRFAYEMCVGEIPEGLELDHLCRERSCVNPDHLEPVTHRENSLRGKGVAAVNASRTHSPQGHPYSVENTFLYRNTRYCRECGRRRTRERYHRDKKSTGGSK